MEFKQVVRIDFSFVTRRVPERKRQQDPSTNVVALLVWKARTERLNRMNQNMDIQTSS